MCLEGERVVSETVNLQLLVVVFEELLSVLGAVHEQFCSVKAYLPG